MKGQLNPQQFSTIMDIPLGKTGSAGDVYVRNIGDGDYIAVLFNGAIDAEKLVQTPVFQRWSWLDNFSIPSAILHDPSITKTGSLRLGWYIGSRSGPTFFEHCEPIFKSIRMLRPGAKIICMGSSAGGFASLMAAYVGLCEIAIVNNPQIDILRYHPSLVREFLSYYGCTQNQLLPQDLSRLSIVEQARSADLFEHIIYAQNVNDKHHFQRHFLPYLSQLYESGTFSFQKFSILAYSDIHAEHSPLSRGNFMGLIKKFYPEILTDEARASAEYALVAPQVPVST